MNVIGIIAVVPQQSIRLISLEPDVEFLVPIPTVKTVVQFADVKNDPRMSVKHQPLITIRQHRRTWWRRCGSCVAMLLNFIIIVVCTRRIYISHLDSKYFTYCKTRNDAEKFKL